MKLRLYDYIAIIFSALLIVFVSFLVYGNGHERLNLYVSAPGFSGIYSMDKNMELKVNGPIGITEIKIENQKAWIVSSPCPNKQCMNSGSIAKNNEWIACIPNKVFISIKGSGGNTAEEEEIDALSN